MKQLYLDSVSALSHCCFIYEQHCAVVILWKSCLCPSWDVCYKSIALFSSGGFKGVKLEVTL